MERQGGNGSCRPGPGGGQAVARASSGLAAVLIVTIVVDVLGNALVILSVLRNKKLRNAELPPLWVITEIFSVQVPLKSQVPNAFPGFGSCMVGRGSGNAVFQLC
uniref:G-protein coupled receptors family 1 profile domain-containing protein n=1 Tax=Anas platyrhynchos platyrhynchos TaxID=8840 RepID=A0A493SZS0_ANAPP